MIRLGREQLVQFDQRLRRAILAIEHEREVGARGGEGRRQLQRAAQQILRIPVAADPPGQFRQHTDRARVERIALQILLEQRLRDVKLPIMQRERGIEQHRRIGVGRDGRHRARR